MHRIFDGSGITSENYSKFLVMAEESSSRQHIIGNVGNGNVQFIGEEAAIARENLVEGHWRFNDGGGYALIEDLMSWDAANSNCNENDGYLATINSVTVKDMLAEICFPDSWEGDSSDDCWLGLKNTGSGEEDSPPKVSGNWAGGDPYSSSDFSLESVGHFGNGKCLNFEAHYHNGTLEGDICSNTRRSICEYPAAAVSD